MLSNKQAYNQHQEMEAKRSSLRMGVPEDDREGDSILGAISNHFIRMFRRKQ